MSTQISTLRVSRPRGVSSSSSLSAGLRLSGCGGGTRAAFALARFGSGTGFGGVRVTSAIMLARSDGSMRRRTETGGASSDSHARNHRSSRRTFGPPELFRGFLFIAVLAKRHTPARVARGREIPKHMASQLRRHAISRVCAVPDM